MAQCRAADRVLGGRIPTSIQGEAVSLRSCYKYETSLASLVGAKVHTVANSPAHSKRQHTHIPKRTRLDQHSLMGRIATLAGE